MFSFVFETNMSFMDYPSHPITVPRSKVDYDSFGTMCRHVETATVIHPRGERIPGHAYEYRRRSGYVYYQIRHRMTGIQLPDYHEIGKQLLVVVVPVASHVYMTLESL